MSLLRYPYTNLHELNLDWIIEQLNQEGPVLSVNEKHGIVTLTGEDINRSPNNQETVSAALTSQGQSIQTVRTQIGVTPLPTVAQTLTGAIAENAQEIANVEDNVIGDTELPTEAQTLTGAIAENADNIGGNANSITNINTKIGTTALPTTAQTLSGAIAENNQGIANVNTKLNNISGLTSGVNNIGNIMCAGYNTASGNYIDLFIPINTNGKTVTAITVSDSTTVYLPTEKINFSSTPTITILETNSLGIRIEMAYTSSQTPNICGVAYLIAISITCS